MAPELLLEGHLDVKSSRQAQSGQSRQPRYNPRAVDVWALGGDAGSSGYWHVPL